jgi:hypothetical protein
MTVSLPLPPSGLPPPDASFPPSTGLSPALIPRPATTPLPSPASEDSPLVFSAVDVRRSSATHRFLPPLASGRLLFQDQRPLLSPPWRRRITPWCSARWKIEGAALARGRRSLFLLCCVTGPVFLQM